jgi:hypothetical protein
VAVCLRVNTPRLTTERVAKENLDQDDPDAVSVLEPHLGQSPGLGDRLPGDEHCGGYRPCTSR